MDVAEGIPEEFALLRQCKLSGTGVLKKSTNWEFGAPSGLKCVCSQS